MAQNKIAQDKIEGQTSARTKCGEQNMARPNSANEQDMFFIECFLLNN